MTTYRTEVISLGSISIRALGTSPYGYHARTPYIVICPITSNLKPYPFKVILPDGLPIKGAVLVDQVKSVDRWARGCDVVGRVPEDVMADIRGRLASLLSIATAK